MIASGDHLCGSSLSSRSGMAATSPAFGTAVWPEAMPCSVA
jgi:hypothetical protein